MFKKFILVLSLVIMIILFCGCGNKDLEQTTYKVYFATENGETLSEVGVEAGELLDEITPPEKEGYKFLGWYLNDKVFDFNTEITSNITLTARWEKIEDEKVYYTVSFNSDGGTSIANQIVEENQSMSKPNDSIKEGYNFVGWYLNDELFDFNTKVTGDLTLVAKWEKIEEKKVYYTVSFNSDGGTFIANQVIEENNSVSRPNNPTKSGYNFVGWYLNNKQFDFSAKVTSDLVLVAKWEKIEEKKVYYTVSFNSDGGTSIANQVIEENKSVSRPNNPTKSGYNFVGWYLNNKQFDFSTRVTGDLTLVAKWEKIEEKKVYYTVSFNSDGGTSIANQVVEENKSVNKPNNPTKEGYNFVGWYLNNEVFDFNTKVTSNLTLVAKWNEILIEKVIDVTEDIPFNTKRVDEVNMLRGTTATIQEGINGKKTVVYKVVYNSRGEELSREKQSEQIISNPTEQILKVGISEYNINSDIFTSGGAGYCLVEDLLVVDGVRVPSCTKDEVMIRSIYINNKSYYCIESNNSCINISDKVIFNNSGVEMIYNGKTYGQSGGYGGGGPQSLTDGICNMYGLACGRW